MKSNNQDTVGNGVMRIRGIDIKTRTDDIDHRKLKFYVDNPRIYSLVRADDHLPDQNEILEQLLNLEHVKELKEDIKANDGLIDPLIVRDGDFVVLEGNSRLAAYKFLARSEPVRWSKVRCTILPADIDEKLVFALLGQYHVKGKKDWAPYEKAGFLYRRYKQHQMNLTVAALEIGIGAREAEHLVDVYDFMIEHKDTDKDRWSYYDEYLKSRKIKKIRQGYAAFDNFIVEQIKDKKISKAMDLRDKLPVICVGPAKVLKRYIDGKISFDEAYESSADAGGENYALRRVKKFREWLVLNETEDDVTEPNKAIRDKIHFELKEIERRAKKLKDRLEQIKTKI
ncbi:ParB N-terminal domain-containing protein [Ferrovibrio sp.]|uniref:ParB N-terminal domain-containing protein n=1 Tax=Ferrovibrio sp. TaxID=1917215 RepID=UPI00311FD0AC